MTSVGLTLCIMYPALLTCSSWVSDYIQWKKCKRAPYPVNRGASVVYKDVAYFRGIDEKEVVKLMRTKPRQTHGTQSVPTACLL